MCCPPLKQQQQKKAAAATLIAQAKLKMAWPKEGTMELLKTEEAKSRGKDD